ncbi:hypothetical protein TNCT_528771 [Trichonephila clavata]|uniref:Uncharacterized protein n=1 Tax=Trichonephila clavata TaxID=2740835 RepID=A0A8X6HEW9_TRICU|nr:hypothetical protein TNCT_528771 [Trichonephila clavata]
MGLAMPCRMITPSLNMPDRLHRVASRNLIKVAQQRSAVMVWSRSKMITPHESQNMVAITLPAQGVTLNLLFHW